MSSDITFTHGDSGVIVDPKLKVSDIDSLTIESASVSISGNYKKEEDLLSFNSVSGISSTWNSLLGKLTLSGSASVNDYVSALRSVTYKNTANLPSLESRTISWTVNDGKADSSVVTSSLAVAVKPLAIDGYYPLYRTQEMANSTSISGGNGTSHQHKFSGITYYMPNGVDFYHGDYVSEEDKDLASSSTSTYEDSASSSSSGGGGGGSSSASRAESSTKQFNQFNEVDLSNVSLRDIKEIDQQQLRDLDSKAVSGFRAEQIDALDVKAVSGFKAGQIKSLDSKAVSGFKAEQIDALDSKAVSGFKAEQIDALDSKAVSGFKAEQIDALD